MVTRQHYIDKILPFVETPLIKVITGVRRCGKSTLMKQLIAHLKTCGIPEEQIVYINRELYAFDFLKTYSDLHKYVSKKCRKKKIRYYIFIDEIQEISEWEKIIASFLAEEKYDIYISGSNAHMLSSELGTLISGRYVGFRIHPLSFSEFTEIYKQHQPDQTSAWADYLKYGGFPGLHQLQWNEPVLQQYLESIYNTIVLKDIVLRNSIRDSNMLNRLLHFIIDNCGNITSARSISDYSKSQRINVSADSILNYLQYTMDAYFIHQIKRYDVQGKKHLETLEKYYICDTGFALATIGNRSSQLSGQLENIVLNELIARDYQVSIGKLKDKEIDFIAEKQGQKMYIQVCATLLGEGVEDREYAPLIKVADHFPKIVLSLDEYGWNTDKHGIRWMNIRDFLLKLHPDTGVV